MDVRTKMLVFFKDFEGLTASAGISAWTSAGYPAPKLTLWAAFSFLKKGQKDKSGRTSPDQEAPHLKPPLSSGPSQRPYYKYYGAGIHSISLGPQFLIIRTVFLLLFLGEKNKYF